MHKKIILSSLLVFLFCVLISSSAHARHEGFYIGGGLQEPVLYTWKTQGLFAPSPGDSMRFFPAFGAYISGGYAFTKPDWLSLEVPVNWGMLKLNKTEWVHLINADAKVAFHLLSDPDKKFDPFISAIAGFVYMTEGSVPNESASSGPDFGASFGFHYTLMEYARAGKKNVTNLSLSVEVPVKIILFLNDYDLSDSATTPILYIPVKVGLTYSF